MDSKQTVCPSIKVEEIELNELLDLKEIQKKYEEQTELLDEILKLADNRIQITMFDEVTKDIRGLIRDFDKEVIQ